MRDLNAEIAGWLRDLAFLQEKTASRWGYKRAAGAVLALPQQLDTLLSAEGVLPKIGSVGPASTRIIVEVMGQGASPTVERLLESAAASLRADIERRRGLRANFLSRAAGETALAQPGIDGPDRADVRCDLQMHSDWSDGSQTLEEIIQTGLSRPYSHSAVTDHSYGLPIAGGLSMARVFSQHEEIDALNRRYEGRFRLLKGIEANIRADGAIDMPFEELAAFEIVVAAPHSALRTSADQTHRMVTAVQTPGVHVLGHPRGRMYGSRPGVSADWERVFRAAADSGVAIELDGDPSRQDLDLELARLANTTGCLFAVDSDAHGTGQWIYADIGLAHARLAGISRERIINCWPLEQLLDWATRRQRGS